MTPPTRRADLEQLMWAWRMGDVPQPRRPVPTTPVRIGDAERDRAVSSLGDHFAAGRLTRDELDERVDLAMAARFDHDLGPLFADLPRLDAVDFDRFDAVVEEDRRTARHRGAPPAAWMPLLWLAPLMLVAAVVVALVLSAPWIIWTFLWFFMITGFLRRRRSHFGSHHGGRPRW